MSDMETRQTRHETSQPATADEVQSVAIRIICCEFLAAFNPARLARSSLILPLPTNSGSRPLLGPIDSGHQTGTPLVHHPAAEWALMARSGSSVVWQISQGHLEGMGGGAGEEGEFVCQVGNLPTIARIAAHHCLSQRLVSHGHIHSTRPSHPRWAHDQARLSQLQPGPGPASAAHPAAKIRPLPPNI